VATEGLDRRRDLAQHNRFARGAEIFRDDDEADESLSPDSAI
jgi:hypothetical protein